jgi:hypothetical protein
MIDLNNYETVKERKKKFYADYPDGRIKVEMQNIDVLEHALVKATIYKTKEEQSQDLAFATGYAHEIRDKELKVSQYGKQYESVNYTSWVENCEESAIGRALDNAGYSGNNKCSREEMKKVVSIAKPKGNFEAIIKAINTTTTIKQLDEIFEKSTQRSWTETEQTKIVEEIEKVKYFIQEVSE